MKATVYTRTWVTTRLPERDIPDHAVRQWLPSGIFPQVKNLWRKVRVLPVARQPCSGSPHPAFASSLPCGSFGGDQGSAPEHGLCLPPLEYRGTMADEQVKDIDVFGGHSKRENDRRDTIDLPPP